MLKINEQHLGVNTHNQKSSKKLKKELGLMGLDR